MLDQRQSLEQQVKTLQESIITSNTDFTTRTPTQTELTKEVIIELLQKLEVKR